ncbi:MAG: prolipoprotein diacylglyceryl transferase [Holosporales bacterium]|nr:prolipoprotein diacylglyceryl transferase [Holosporales bacterium]
MFVLNIDPIALSIGRFNIYWYGVMYALSLFISWKIACIISRSASRNGKNNSLIPNVAEIDKFMFVGIIMCVFCARLGHIFFFEFEYYFAHPKEILMLRNGGMSFHGGIIGLIISVFWFSKKYRYSFTTMSDILSFSGSLGIFLGRIANFINQELYGTVTSVNWAVIFKNVDMLPRHPTQIYESVCEGLLSFFIMLYFWKRRGNTAKSIGSGAYTFVFLIVYSSSRYIIEFFKEVEVITYFDTFSMTVGQILSIALFMFAFLFLLLTKRYERDRS